MTITRRRAILFILILAAGLFSLSSGFAESTTPGGEKVIGGASIVIKSDSMEIDNSRRIVTFTGNVNAAKDSFRIRCREMLVYYMERPGKGAGEKKGLGIDKIVARGTVRITREDGGVATSEEAVYYQSDERVVLTGNPVVKQGDDFVEGARVILFLKEKRSIVEGSGDQKVRAVLFPRSEKR